MAEPQTNKNLDSDQRVADNNYDRGITPAETAARMQREGDQFKKTPSQDKDSREVTDDQTHPGDTIDTTAGYTVDKEGLLNNYAVEPEMYYETPGDARQELVDDAKLRVQTENEVNEDKQGELTMDRDVRGKGPGAV
ncbi:hypothetical protein [Iningainema tapete]|uniref:Uncharacterized protein n=1 Tax=Iningainema tapete BLCC-T55 TaxID=2748662 RepID=A0A8J6XGJ1_9CYAN|nr:hypothetical protein [Iningainema tapete]MBD2772735.1 hypothetical protein [Iningainema tapete BLCC-T55]